MLRTAMALSVALLMALCVAQASAAPVTTPVRGTIRAIAVSGDGVLAARRPKDGKLVVERMVPGAPTQLVLTTIVDSEDDELTLAGSAEALAVAVNPEAEEDNFGASRVFIGPAIGPMREVSVCPAGLVASPVSVLGSRIAWRDGSCGEPPKGPRGVGPSAVMVGGADPRAPLRRAPVSGPGLPASIVLGPGDSGLVGTLLPSFFLVDSEVHSFGPAGIGGLITAEQGRFVSPVGILADGTRVFMIATEDEEADCAVELFTMAATSGERRPLSLGGCPQPPPSPGASSGLRVTADRVVGLVAGTPPRNGGQRRISVVSVRADGSDRRVLARGTFRAPLGVGADANRVAWWQHRCRGQDEIVTQALVDTTTTSIATCRVEVLTRSARVRGGKIDLRVRCPAGCLGSLLGRYLSRGPTTFSFGPGTRTLRVGISLGKLRRARFRLEVLVDNGPPRSVRLSVRR